MKKKLKDFTVEELVDYCSHRSAEECHDGRCPLSNILSSCDICGLTEYDLDTDMEEEE